MKLYIADAFTRTRFGGNPAGVVILDPGMDYPDTETMRLTAAELRYSETAFIKPLEEGFQLRYFTPADEVDLCGHATIASFHVLREMGYAKAGTTLPAKTLAGDIEIEIGEDSILMGMADPKFMGEISDEEALRELYEIMGLSWPRGEMDMLPQLISTGLPDIIMPVPTAADLDAINPDFPALTELSRKYEVTGVHAFTLDTDGRSTACCRNFAPLYDIDEEAATGTSSGALTYYLSKNGIIADVASCSFIQGEAMNRPSLIRTHCEGDKIQVGGSAVILVEGEIYI